jgi:hypothetical protein
MNSLTTVDQSTQRELLVIERLAAALEKCASVDEIKDVRDRAMAIQLYTRKKAGGLAAAQAAGRVVTDATLRLAELYRSEDDARADNGRAGKKILGPGQEYKSGKAALAKAAGIGSSDLARMRHVLEASAPTIEVAKAAIEARGDVVTPGALLKQLTSAPPKLPKAARRQEAIAALRAAWNKYEDQRDLLIPCMRKLIRNHDAKSDDYDEAPSLLIEFRLSVEELHYNPSGQKQLLESFKSIIAEYE